MRKLWKVSVILLALVLATSMAACASDQSSTHTHSPGSAWISNDETHWHECTECGEKSDEAEHTVSTDWKTDGENHWKECTVCGQKLEVAAHTAGSDWKTDGENHWKECNVCGAKLEVTAHTAGTDWKTDDDNHWKECNVCGAKLDEAAHAAATDWKTDGETHWRECVCGKKLDEAAHTAGTEWKTDGENHWHECTVCGEKLNEAAHTAGTEWKTDGENHWHECTVCEEKVDEAAHTAGTDWKTDDDKHWKECTVCSAKLEDAAHTAVTDWITDGTYHWKECSCGKQLYKAEHTAGTEVYYNKDHTVQWNECECGLKMNEAAHTHVYNVWATVDGKDVAYCDCGETPETFTEQKVYLNTTWNGSSLVYSENTVSFGLPDYGDVTLVQVALDDGTAFGTGAAELNGQLLSIKRSGFSSAYGSHVLKVTVTDGENQFTAEIPLILVTAEINNLNDFLNLPKFSDALAVGADESAGANRLFGGYFELTADLDYSESGYWKDRAFNILPYFSNNAVVENGDYKYGFDGVIDGMGHTISNLRTDNQGLIYTIRKNGAIRNISFTGLKVIGSNNIGTLCCGLWGTIENVYLDYAEISVTAEGKTFYAITQENWRAQGSYSKGLAKDCVVDISRAKITLAANTAVYLTGYGSGEVSQKLNAVNLIAITGGLTTADVFGDNERMLFATADDLRDSDVAQEAIAGWSDFWIICDGRPLPYNDYDADAVVTVEGDSEINTGSSMTVVISPAVYTEAELSTAAIGQGITFTPYDNKLTVPANAAPGKYTLTVSYMYDLSKTDVLEFTVKSVTKLTIASAAAPLDVDFDLDSSGVSQKDSLSFTLTEESIDFGELTSVTVNGSVATDKFTLDGVTLKAKDIHEFEKEWGAQTIIVNTANGDRYYEITINALFVSKFIYNPADLNSMKTIADAVVTGADEPADGSYSLKQYGGYFALANDIDYNHASFTNYQMAIWWGGGTWNASDANGYKYGFSGTFDGRGHTISNLTIGNGAGFIGILKKDGVIKNVAFTGARLTATDQNCSFLTGNHSGTIENVYVKFDSLQLSNAAAVFCGVTVDNSGLGTIKNVYIDASALTAQSITSGSGAVSKTYLLGQEKAPNINCVAVGNLAELSICDVNASGKRTVCADETALKASADAQAAMAEWDSVFWTVTDGVPSLHPAAQA